MKVEIVNAPWGKDWVKITLFRFNSFFISFEDLHRIIRAIAECEDKKYPNGEGRIKFFQFLGDAVFIEEYEELAKRYQIPIRDQSGNVIVSNNSKYEEIK